MLARSTRPVARCAQLISAHELKSRAFYDVIVKMRDNTLVVSPFVPTAKHLAITTWWAAAGTAPRVLAKRCVQYGDTSDKVMVIPRQHMESALRAPSEDTFAVQGVRKGIRNAEGLMKWLLKRNDLEAVRALPEALPFVDGRCSPFGWCLVELQKDCRPATWSYPTKPCEEFNATAAQRAIYKQRSQARAQIAEGLSSLSSTAISHVISPSVDQSDNATANRSHVEAIGRNPEALSEAMRRELKHGLLSVDLQSGGLVRPKKAAASVQVAPGRRRSRSRKAGGSKADGSGSTARSR